MGVLWLFVLLRPFRGPEVASVSVSLGSSPPAQLSSLCQGRPLGALGLRCPSRHLTVGARRFLAPSGLVPHSPRVFNGNRAAPGGRQADGHPRGAGRVAVTPRGCVRGSPVWACGAAVPPGPTGALGRLARRVGFRPRVLAHPRAPLSWTPVPCGGRSVLRGHAADFSALPSNRARTSLIRDPLLGLTTDRRLEASFRGELRPRVCPPRLGTQ